MSTCPPTDLKQSSSELFYFFQCLQFFSKLFFFKADDAVGRRKKTDEPQPDDDVADAPTADEDESDKPTVYIKNMIFFFCLKDF